MPDPGFVSNCLDNSPTRAIIIMVLPLPGPPRIQSRRVSLLSFQRRKSRSSRIHAHEPLSNLSLLASILAMSSRGSVDRRSLKQSVFLASYGPNFTHQRLAERTSQVCHPV